jgi:hypothetical protein
LTVQVSVVPAEEQLTAANVPVVAVIVGTAVGAVSPDTPVPEMVTVKGITVVEP